MDDYSDDDHYLGDGGASPPTGFGELGRVAEIILYLILFGGSVALGALVVDTFFGSR